MKIKKLIKNVKYLNRAAEAIGIAASPFTYPDRSVTMLSEDKDGKSQGDRVHFLNAGISDCVLIQSICHFALVDFGDPEFADSTLSYLRKTAGDEDGNIDIDFAVFNSLTQKNLDSFKLILADPRIRIGEIYINTLYKDNLKESERFADDIRNKAIELSISKCIKIKSIVPSDPIEFGSIEIEFLNTQPDNYHRNIESNDNSLAINISRGNKNILVLLGLVNTTGDISRIADGLKNVDVLALPKNGTEKLSEKTLKLLNPKAMILQNKLENINQQIIGDLMLNTNANIYSTYENKGIAITFAGELKFNNNIQ